MDDILIGQAKSLVATLPRVMRRMFTLQCDAPAMELPVAQLRVCAVLHDGPRNMSVIGKELGISLSAVTQLADRLERAEMVERLAEPEDRRVRCLQLTPHGIEVMRLRKERRLRQALNVMEKLTPEQREAVLAALETLLGVCTTDVPDLPTDIPIIA